MGRRVTANTAIDAAWQGRGSSWLAWPAGGTHLGARLAAAAQCSAELVEIVVHVGALQGPELGLNIVRGGQLHRQSVRGQRALTNLPSRWLGGATAAAARGRAPGRLVV